MGRDRFDYRMNKMIARMTALGCEGAEPATRLLRHGYPLLSLCTPPTLTVLLCASCAMKYKCSEKPLGKFSESASQLNSADCYTSRFLST